MDVPFVLIEPWRAAVWTMLVSLCDWYIIIARTKVACRILLGVLNQLFEIAAHAYLPVTWREELGSISLHRVMSSEQWHIISLASGVVQK